MLADAILDLADQIGKLTPMGAPPGVVRGLDEAVAGLLAAAKAAAFHEVLERRKQAPVPEPSP